MPIPAEPRNAVLLLGLADYFSPHPGAPFPFGPIDLFQLSQHKVHIVYPASIQSNYWVLLIATEFLKGAEMSEWQMRLVDENNAQIGSLNFESAPPPESQSSDATTQPLTTFPVVADVEFQLVPFQVDALLNNPGVVRLESEYRGETTVVGAVHFHYQKAPALTADKLRAIESNPSAIKTIRMDLGCKHCPTKLCAYTGLSRSTRLESEGVVWQSDLPEEFACECGRTRMSLEYLRDSMHGLLLKDFDAKHSHLNYVRRYGHEQVQKIVADYAALLNKERLEGPVQDFIEENPLLLCRFHAKRLYIKPEIPGRFAADFALVDSRNQLWLIELEKPSLKLFRKDKHPTQGLMHAYGQVTDWLHQYAKHPGAVLESLGLSSSDVSAVRGAVIAGRSADVTPDVLQRHLSNPPYPNIEFMTCDDLSASLIEISKSIA